MTPEQLIETLLAFKETDLHDKLYVPFLEHLGATNVKNIHGPNEFGRDFVFNLKDGLIGRKRLGICQVKNDKSSNREAQAVLNQLLQALEIEVTNPESNRKELPQEAYFFSVFDLPDLPDGNSLLNKVMNRCICLTGKNLAKALLEHIPSICA